jgi:hypothetical protein
MMLLKQHLNCMKRVYVASCLMCGQKMYMKCQLCIKHVCFKSGKGMSCVSCCIDFNNDLMYSLDFMDCVELFGVQKTKFKKDTMAEVKKNKIHMRKVMMKHHEHIWDKDKHIIGIMIACKGSGLVLGLSMDLHLDLMISASH